jgi:hypothetical protein
MSSDEAGLRGEQLAPASDAEVTGAAAQQAREDLHERLRLALAEQQALAEEEATVTADAARGEQDSDETSQELERVQKRLQELAPNVRARSQQDQQPISLVEVRKTRPCIVRFRSACIYTKVVAITDSMFCTSATNCAVISLSRRRYVTVASFVACV